MRKTPSFLNPSGYTLIELVIVVAILGIVALVATPRFSSIDDEQKISLAASELANALRFARERAMNTGLDHNVVIDPYKKSFKVTAYDPVGNSYKTVSNPADQKEYIIAFDSSTMMSGVNFKSISINGSPINTTTTITFSKFGQPVVNNGDGRPLDADIVLSYGNSTKKVYVAAMTGRISLAEASTGPVSVPGPGFALASFGAPKAPAEKSQKGWKKLKWW